MVLVTGQHGCSDDRSDSDSDSSGGTYGGSSQVMVEAWQWLGSGGKVVVIEVTGLEKK